MICSKFITFVVEMTTRSQLRIWARWVVICSKFITFVVEMTTKWGLLKFKMLLWFAQNSLPLWLKWQHDSLPTLQWLRCDLLKIHYLCGWNDNNFRMKKIMETVVICSKFITFVVEMTTLSLKYKNKDKLWFAQNSLPLWLKWQPCRCGLMCFVCCDLLKIHYLCGWNDNLLIKGYFEIKLWFAQNSLPLWLKWQPYFISFIIRYCCDLLKIHYLCGWNDNWEKEGIRNLLVVICSKFITFVVEMTTWG